MFGGVGPLAALVTGFMVNFRHVFYGLTYPRHRIRSWWGRAYSTYALTDEAYAIVSAMPRAESARLSAVRILTIQLGCQVAWVGSGVLGALAGNIIPADVRGMEFALVALFIVLAADSFRNNPDLSLPLSAGLLAVTAALCAPEHLLLVALCAYFGLLFIRHVSPRLDGMMQWRMGKEKRDA